MCVFVCVLVTPYPGNAKSLPFQSVSSVAQSCPTLCDPMNRSTPGLPAHHQLPEFTQTHVHLKSLAQALDCFVLVHILLYMTSVTLIWKVKVKSLSRVQLYSPMNCSLPGSSAHGIFQARILEWGAISYSRGSSQPRDQTHIS